MEASLLSLAVSIAAAAALWSPKELQQMEASREGCRMVCSYLGITPETRCLANLWVALTAAMVKMGDFSAGEDIDVNGMGLPLQPKEFEDLKRLNIYQKKFLVQDLETLIEFLPKVRDFNPSLAWLASVAAGDVIQMLS
eukprot:Skav236393  [mRNA]  locus=scaffold29:251915:252331:+ [translate_table: standard]